MTDTPTLASQLAAFRAEFMNLVDADIRAAMERADALIEATGIAGRAINAGDIAPDFTLPDAGGGKVTLSELLRNGPVVLSFYRGGWCPYCNLELRALQNALPALAERGASLVAVSPQSPDESLSTQEKNELAFPVLSDVGSAVGQAYGVAFALPEELRPIYERLGHALPPINGSDDWMLPIPATYVIAPDRRVVRAHVEVDYRTRLEPSQILAALDALRTTA